MIKTTTVYAKFKKKMKMLILLHGQQLLDLFLPNVALTVNPNVTYVKVKYKDEIFYLAEKFGN